MAVSSDNKRIAKNTIFLTIRMMVVLAINLYTTRLVLHVLGVIDYGVFNVVCGFVSMFTFLNTSMSNGIQRFYNYELGRNGEKGANRVYMTSFLIQLLLAIIIVLLVESFGIWYLHNKMEIPEYRLYAAECIFHLSVIGFVFIIMQAPYTAAVMAHECMDFYAIISVLDAALKLCIILFIPILSGDSLIWFGFLMILINITDFLFYFIYCKRKFIEIKIQKLFDYTLFKPMLVFSGWNLFGSFSAVMQDQGINLVLNSFFGPIVNAARGVATQVNSGLEGFVANITMPVRPQVVQSYARGDNNRMMNLTFSISKLSCCFLMMMAIPISVEIDYVLNIWLGDSVPDHSAAFTIIILFSSLISNLNAATSNVVHATGIMKHYQFWGSIIKISSVPIAFFVLQYWLQAELALIIVFFCRTAGHVVGLFIVRKLVKMSLRKYLAKVILPIIIMILFSLCFTIPVKFIIDEGFLRLLVITLLSILSVGCSLYYFGFNNNERQLALQLVRGFISRFRN